MNNNIIRNSYQISRRRFLRGAGVVMALPWLESVPVWGADPVKADGTPGAFPKRLAILFMGNGVNPNQWWATGQGDATQYPAQPEPPARGRGAAADAATGARIAKLADFGPSLEPLNPYKDKINYISGLFNKAATGVGIHPGMTGNLLSGMPLTKGAELHGGVSMDQVLATRIGDQTVQPSMVIGCEQPVSGYHETNFSMAYSSHISWSSPTSPVPMEVYPSLAFDSLFDNKGNQRDQSVLDRVMDQAATLTRQVSSADKSKLDEYLTSVREVEKRAQDMRAAKERADAKGKDAKQPVITMQRPDNGLPEDIREHMKLMTDILALGFQTDKTRIATLLLCRDISGLFYPFLNVKLAHHLASHQDHTDDFMHINQYYASQYAYLIDKLAKMPEGEGTVLDNSCLVFMSNMWSGSAHDNSKLPILTAGNLGGTLETGRVFDYTAAGDENRKVCSFYLSLMDRMGVKLDKFGDADARLDI
jgi:hypothetical protein